MQFRNDVTCLILSAVMGSAYANPTMDFCSNLPGPWDGNAIVSYTIAANTLRCEYTVKALLSRPVLDPYHFTADISLKRASGVCFLNAHLIVPGICNGTTGEISIQTDDANLSGMTDGSTAKLHGQLNIRILGKVMTTDVEKLELQKR